MMERFEYKIIKRIRNDKKEVQQLNKLGSERWQVVSVKSKEIYLIRVKRGD